MRAVAKKLLVVLSALALMMPIALPTAGAFTLDEYITPVVRSVTNLDDLIVDFGEVDYNRTFKKSIRFKNNLATKVYLSVEDRPNSPFAIDFANTDEAIQPGDTGRITFKVSQTRLGTAQSRAKVVYIPADGNWASAAYYIDLVSRSSNINGPGALVPSARTVDFGEVPVGQRSGYSRAVTFRNTYATPVDLSVTNGTGDAFNYRFPQGKRVPAYGTLEVQFEFDPPEGRDYSDTFAVKTDGVDNYATYEIKLKGSGTIFNGCRIINGQVLCEDTPGRGGNSETLIRDFSAFADQELFLGRPAAVRTEFKLSNDSYLNLRVYDAQNRLISRVFSDRFYNGRSTSQSHTFILQQPLTPSTSYRFELTATTFNSPTRTDTDNYTLRGGPIVQPPGGGGGGIVPGGGCAGFVDVASGSSFCDAVEFVVAQGIFTGDTGSISKSLRPNDKVVRAEAVAIMLRAVDGRLDSNYPLPFYDVQDSAWYAPWLRKAVSTGAINGYPDGTFKPNQTMTRAEWYKSFVTLVSNSRRASYFVNSDVRYRPFADTTLQRVNMWYLPFADWARRYFDRTDFARRQFGTNNLGVNETNGYFKPDQPITRGHIIELIHEMHLKGIASF